MKNKKLKIRISANPKIIVFLTSTNFILTAVLNFHIILIGTQVE